MTASQNNTIFDRTQISEKYVAFVDILGFSSRVLNNFEGFLVSFEQLLKSTKLIEEMRPDTVKVTVYSDSYLLVSNSLGPLVAAVQALHMQTLFWDCLIRGGIAHGRHIEVSRPPNLLVASEALIRAVAIEKTIRFPCVAIHPEIVIPDDWWPANVRNLDRGILYFGGKIVVNPCNLMWGQSAGTRVAQMLQDSPQHRDKYEWFLELHQAIFSPVPMIPPRFFNDDRGEQPEDSVAKSGGRNEH
jgi:hypothetical protein